MTTPLAFHIRAARADEHGAIYDHTMAAYAIYAELMPPSGWAELRQALLGALAAAIRPSRSSPSRTAR